MKQIEKTQENIKPKSKYDDYMLDLKRDNNVIKVTYFSGKEEELPYSEERMQALKTKQAGQVCEVLSDMPFVDTLRTAGMLATFLLFLPYCALNKDYATIRQTTAIIGAGTAFAVLSFILNSNMIEERKNKIYLRIKPYLEEHYNDLKHLKVYRTKGELTSDNLDQYTLREVKRVKRELDDITPEAQTKKKLLMKKYGITGIKQ